MRNCDKIVLCVAIFLMIIDVDISQSMAGLFVSKLTAFILIVTNKRIVNIINKKVQEIEQENKNI